MVWAMSRFRRASLGAGFGYSPGEQPADADGWLKLNTNELPLPPSSHVAAAVAAAAADLARYPDPSAEPLRSALARYHGVAPTQVFVANGADQVLDCLYRAFASPGDTVVRTDPGYSLLPVLAALFSARDVAVSLAPDGALPSGFATEPGVVRVIVNPNSPTGRWIEPTELETALQGAAGIVAVDEAYCDFAPGSCVGLLRSHPNWVIVRTLSKSHALAGLRVGYALAASDVIDDLLAVKELVPRRSLCHRRRDRGTRRRGPSPPHRRYGRARALAIDRRTARPRLGRGTVGSELHLRAAALVDNRRRGGRASA